MKGVRRKLDDKNLKCQFLSYERAGWLLNRPVPRIELAYRARASSEREQ